MSAIAPLNRTASHGSGVSTTVALDLSALDASAKEAWLAFVESAAGVVGVGVSIESFTGQPPGDASCFAYLSASAALSRKLLLNVPRIYIQPRAAPTQVDAYFWSRGDLAMSWQPVRHTVTLISSVFRGDEFLAGFLDNCAALEGYGNCEHLLIRAASPGNEHARLVEHVRQWPSAVYLNLTEDPGLYDVWNLGARLATGRYLSNANIDDRRAPEQLTHLQAILDGQPGVSVASTALRVSTHKNLAWEDSADCRIVFDAVGEQVYAVDGLFKWVGARLASRNLPHCMPLWRRSLHCLIGEFDEKRHGSSADWAFWLRAGRRGALFHISPQPLGLYLRDEGSYWRRDATNRDFDARIVEEFGVLAKKNDAPVTGHQWTKRPLGLELPGALRLLESGASLDGVGHLLSAVTDPPSMSATARVLFDKVAESFLGCADGVGWVMRYANLSFADQLPDIAFFNALVDLVHGFDPGRLGESAVRIKRNLEFACIDLHELSGDGRGLMLLAFLARRCGDMTFEQRVLRYLHDEDAVAFWSSVQSVYRFTRPLPNLCAALSNVAPALESGEPIAKKNVVYFPAFRNAYQSLLYGPLHAAGGQVHGTSDAQEFLSAIPIEHAENILHLHWISPLFGRPGSSSEMIAQRTASFLDGLTRQKKAGFQVFWTIHNYLSHESADKAAELVFRQALYRLADRVFIHHPLAASLLDWLPDMDKLCLCEHGNYDSAVTHRVSRTAARAALGYSPDDFVLTYTGQVRDYKGLSDVLPVIFEQLVATPRMKLVIAGQIKSAEVKHWLRVHAHPRLIVRYGFLSDDELILHMRAADIGLLSYSAVLTSGALFHWFTCGRAVLAPVRGTIPGYLVDGWNGYGYRDADTLRHLLSHCAALSGNALEYLGNNALTTAQQLEWRLWKI